LLEEGKIIVNIKINVYRHGERMENIKDHGTSFRINYNDVDKNNINLYRLIKIYRKEGQRVVPHKLVENIYIIIVWNKGNEKKTYC